MSEHYYVDRGYVYGPERRVRLRLGVVRRRSRHDPLPRTPERQGFPLAA